MSFSGKYQNELGSIAVINFDHENGEINGRYKTAVGNVEKSHKIVGTFHKTENGDFTLAFVVTWFDMKEGYSPSSSAWTGYIKKDNPKRIETKWLLCRTGKDDWESYLTGSNSFDFIGDE